MAFVCSMMCGDLCVCVCVWYMQKGYETIDETVYILIMCNWPMLSIVDCGRNIFLIPFLIDMAIFPFCGRKENQIRFHRIILFDCEMKQQQNKITHL